MFVDQIECFLVLLLLLGINLKGRTNYLFDSFELGKLKGAYCIGLGTGG